MSFFEMDADKQILCYSCCGVRLKTAGVMIGLISGICSLLFNFIIVLDLFNYRGTLLQLFCISSLAVNNGLSVYQAIAAVDLFASLMLVVGAVKVRHFLLIPWLLNSAFATLFYTVSFIYLSISTYTEFYTFSCIRGTLIFFGLATVIFFLCWYTVYSLFYEMKHIDNKLDVLREQIFYSIILSFNGNSTFSTYLQQRVEDHQKITKEEKQPPPSYSTLL